jgi:tetratricopeptide (TPR) repeat protein
VLRAGPFSDERIIRLVNRRFVPLYFDLATGGALKDPAARDFVVKVKKELGGGAVPTPPVLVLTPDGELLAEASNYASEDALLGTLRDVLRDHAGWNALTKEEAEIEASGAPLPRADLLFDLGREDEARRVLAKEVEATASPEAALLLARFCRLGKRWSEMELALAPVRDLIDVKDAKTGALAAAHHVERAWLLLATDDFDAALEHAGQVPEKSARHTEARYVAGLAQWHAGKRDAALRTWKQVIEGCSQDPWIYRADWAYTQAKQGPKSSFGTGGAKVSLLGRIGYMGRGNPDLELP